MKKLGVFLGLLLALGQGAANATAIISAKEAAAEEKVKQQIKTAFPEVTVESIEKSPLHGLYQVTAGPVIFYASSDGHYLLLGDVFDLTRQDKDKRNLTENLRKKSRLELLKSIKTSDMVLYQPKTVKGVVTVFTDTDCGYCRKLHSEVAQLVELGIEVRYLAFPRQGVGSPTYDQMVSVWCAKDRAKALSDAMDGKEIETKTCQNNLAEQFSIGQKMGLNGTPTLLFPDGTLVGGYVPAEKLAKEAMKHNLTE
jgi:thiol:disulfide interchange protein DsbC